MKIVSSIATAFVLSMSITAQAKLLEGGQCDFRDHQLINRVIQVAAANQPDLAAELEGIMQQEMGPRCTKMFDTEIKMTIPGTTLSDFKIETQDAAYLIHASTDRINPGRFNGTIERLN